MKVFYGKLFSCLFVLLSVFVLANPVIAKASTDIDDTNVVLAGKPIIVKNDSPNITISGTWNEGLKASKEKPASVITVRSGFSGTITLKNISVDVSQIDYAAAIRLEDGAKPVFVLEGKNMLKSGTTRAGMVVPSDSEIRISGGGSLTSTGGDGGAGIGGNAGMVCGVIHISQYGDHPDTPVKSPQITAIGGQSAAGIGGGSKADGGTVNISGGLINAIGGKGAKDIGYGAGKADAVSGYTSVQAGRLVRYDNICWSKYDSEPRRQIKIICKSAFTITFSKDSFPPLAPADIPTEIGSKELEKNVAYLYAPFSVDKISLELTTYKLSGSPFYWSASEKTTTYDFSIPQDCPIIFVN